MGGMLGLEGYTGYLVVAYGVTALVVIGNVLAARRQFRRTQSRLRQQLERRSGRRPQQATQVPGQAGDQGRNEATVGRGS
jgi:heme exporter protein CcmD